MTAYTAAQIGPCQPGQIQGSLEDQSLIRSIPNAHTNVITGLIPIDQEGTIISGSEDGMMGCWTPQGERKWDRYSAHGHDVSPPVTALGTLDKERWISGTKKGTITVWTNEGSPVASWNIFSTVDKVASCPPIKCFCVGSTFQKSPTFLVGQSTQFSKFTIQGKKLETVETREDDWIFALHPLPGNRLVVATGPTLSVWQKRAGEWKKTATLMQETGPMTSSIRPFISSITPLAALKGRIGAAVFDGSVRLLDIETCQKVRTWQCHEGKALAIINCRDSVLASAGEDRCVKVWDVRNAKSVQTIQNDIGPVTKLLNVSENFFWSAACPQPFKGGDGAILRYRDMRMIFPK